MKTRFNFFIEEEDLRSLKELSDKTGLPISSHLRQMLNSLTPLHSQVLSGATVLGTEIHTTSGSVWIGKGL